MSSYVPAICTKAQRDAVCCNPGRVCCDAAIQIDVKAFAFDPDEMIFRQWESVWLARHAPRNLELKLRSRPHVQGAALLNSWPNSSSRSAQFFWSTGRNLQRSTNVHVRLLFKKAETRSAHEISFTAATTAFVSDGHCRRLSTYPVLNSAQSHIVDGVRTDSQDRGSRRTGKIHRALQGRVAAGALQWKRAGIGQCSAPTLPNRASAREARYP